MKFFKLISSLARTREDKKAQDFYNSASRRVKDINNTGKPLRELFGESIDIIDGVNDFIGEDEE